ncbi:hypothetical protein C8255_21970 [filamentous cyanobacterium CCP3]|nr:hypothetical protein C8255_21970 [filamentous cyanobacterium CCP3]
MNGLAIDNVQRLTHPLQHFILSFRSKIGNVMIDQRHLRRVPNPVFIASRAGRQVKKATETQLSHHFGHVKAIHHDLQSVWPAASQKRAPTQNEYPAQNRTQLPLLLSM